SVQTNFAGSTNFISYGIQGSANEDVVINASLNVDFGTGNGRLSTAVLATLPTSLVDLTVVAEGAISNLGQESNVQIAAQSTSGTNQDLLPCRSLGLGANLSDVDTGGSGHNVFGATLLGTEEQGATLTLQFTGGDGNNTAAVFDNQDINGGSTTIDLQGNGNG